MAFVLHVLLFLVERVANITLAAIEPINSLPTPNRTSDKTGVPPALPEICKFQLFKRESDWRYFCDNALLRVNIIAVLFFQGNILILLALNAPGVHCVE